MTRDKDEIHIPTNGVIRKPVEVRPTPSNAKQEVIEPSVKTVIINQGPRVHIRERPNAHSNSIIRLLPGYVLQVLEVVVDEHRTWYNVRTNSGITGYVHSSCVKVRGYDNNKHR